MDAIDTFLNYFTGTLIATNAFLSAFYDEIILSGVYTGLFSLWSIMNFCDWRDEEDSDPNPFTEMRDFVQRRMFIDKCERLSYLLPDTLPEPETIKELEGCSFLKTIEKFPEYDFYVLNKGGKYYRVGESNDTLKVINIEVSDILWIDQPTRNTLITKVL